MSDKLFIYLKKKINRNATHCTLCCRAKRIEFGGENFAGIFEGLRVRETKNFDLEKYLTLGLRCF